MFRKLLLVLFFTISSLCHAEEDKTSGCTAISGLAETMMTNRQKGVAMSKMMELIKEIGKGSKITNSIESYVVRAYEQPRYSSPEMQKRSIEEFRDEVHLECVKALL
jgi:hypothetical protein